MTEQIKNMFSRDKTTEQQRHELAVIDAAVRGSGTNHPEDAALTDFALRISSARSLPNDGFYRELDERFAGGAHVPPPRKRSFSVMGAGAGALASIVLVAGVVIATQLPGSDDRAVSSEPQSSRPAELSKDSLAGADGGETSSDNAATGSGLSTAPPITPQAATPGAIRIQAMTAQLALATAGSNIENVADGVIRTTDRFGGYVGNSSVSGGDANSSSATFELQLPADKFQPALAELSKLAHVRSRTQNTQDVTAPYSQARSGLRIARAQRDRLLTAYAAAEPGSTEAAALKTRLRRAEARVDARRTEVTRLNNRINYVPMSVTIAADNSVVADERGTIGRAADAALSVLTAAVAVLIVGLAVALPVALIGGAAWLATKRIRRRRRNSALDQAAV